MSVDYMSKKEVRKVVQTGNSLSVGLPKKIIDSLNIKRGDEIEFDVKDNQIVLKKKRNWEQEVDAEMLEMLAETFEEHNEVFERLKDR
ncbi:AbrB/MazE/SpoVT family DNA-binding domain-containing protein [Gracilibacillus salitolerans]|uniref:AbrB/MazE/SpoVT family DNA-binding domain-containing protein n=1 Tax=Gracilibacillus salitolerans TaxID=2663022 RepID=A0A5Q2TMH7_9BACI|nr:AbrB/MazE/SpoVT family DNA-binding domain-containing protein [Gracilibacillus salitolerans]QGH36149.1 AbrB/MazE/SpoVT family DNA-binding domain-containing protein [Gracilibacillus salitolerans]